MKVLVILDSGIPEYREFLFEELASDPNISEFKVLHNGRIYNGTGNFEDSKVRYFGNNKFGFHLGLGKYIDKYDVIITSYNLKIITCWIYIFFKKKPKWIIFGKGYGENKTPLISYFRKQIAKRADKILVYNNFKKLEFERKTKISPKKVIAFNNTLKISNPGYNRNSERSCFLYFGRLQERKGLIELLRAFKYYIKSKDIHNAKRLRLVGNGDFKKELVSEAIRLKVFDFVDFYPGVYDDKSIKEHFDCAIAYVSPYNVGLGIVNSLAYGVPVLTCSLKQMGPEFNYLNNENAIILESIEDLNLGLLKLEALSSEFSLKCYNYYQKNLSYQYMVRKFKDVILDE